MFTTTVAALVAVLVWSAVTLPERVPQHYGLDGQADACTSRTAYLVGASIFVAVMVTVFVGCAHLALRGDLEWFDVPHADYWKHPDNVDRLRRMAADDVWRLGSATLLLLIALGVATAVVADDPTPSLGAWWDVLFVAYIAGAVTWCWYLVKRRYAPPKSATDRSAPADQ
ncbi:DUF1648 domain-containing protein [Pseudokineococcus basanitobsidens]|uniref:DUF1648 domain-containing protein n=1 Tax=Pseudokineococcus basanitobsidens TaxID=1926649 RepID=A0ABU8RPF7_9ACTN